MSESEFVDNVDALDVINVDEENGNNFPSPAGTKKGTLSSEGLCNVM